MKTRSRIRASKSDTEATRKRLSHLAWLLDSSIPVPGLNFRIGLDALLGLIPGVGDALGVLLSSYILREAARLGVSKTILIRMGLNVLVEGLIGIIPFAGDVFDAAWKANQRNVRLLSAYLDNPRKATGASRGFVFIVTLLVIGFLLGTGILGFVILRWLWNMISS